MNLRDQGYPSARSYVPNRSDKRMMPMTGDTEAPFYSGTSTETITNNAPSIMDRIINAYNNRMFGNPNAPMLQNINADGLDGSAIRGVSVVRHGSPDLSGRIGFASKDVSQNGDTSYHVGLDNGASNRGVFDAAINTPVGSFGGGFEDETNYLTYSSPTNKPLLDPSNEPLFDARYFGGIIDNPIEASAGVGRSDLGGNMLYADLSAPFINRDGYNSVDTPLGNFSIGSSAASPVNNGYAAIDFTPNQYIQALINALNK